MEKSPVKMLQQLRRRVQSVTYGSPIYKMMLEQGPMPERLRLTVSDPWPGDAKQGQALIASQDTLFDLDIFQSERQRRRALTHEGLRDLRAVGTDMARRKAVSMIHEWMDDQAEWDEEAWYAPVLGARLSNWIAFYDFYAPAVSHDFTKKLILCMVRQLRHLLHISQGQMMGVEGLLVIKGLIYGGMGLIDGEKAVGLALELLTRQLEVEILPDGGVASRNPLAQAEMLRALIDIRAALRVAQLELPPDLSLAITRMVPALKFFRHGDGGLALFHGSREGGTLLIDASLTLSEAKGRALKRLPQTGYERLTAGRSLLMIDVGHPPSKAFDHAGHAGLMSFEFSVGRERILTNCGAAPLGDDEWRRAMAATAAHNTIIIEDTNACEVLPEGGIGHRPREVISQRYEQDNVQYVDIAHDGYFPQHKVKLQRTFSLSPDGDELRGGEMILGPTGKDFAIRWHLHPDVNALLAQGGSSALLRTASGAGWRLRVKGVYGESLALESSIYCGGEVPRRTLQLRISGRVHQMPTLVEWTLTREKTKKGS